MNRPLVVNPLAEDDIAQASDWYEGRRAGLSEDFRESLEKSLEQIWKWPELHAKVFGDLRMTKIRRFPYAVLYRIDDDQITVIAVYHTSRDPRDWQKR